MSRLRNRNRQIPGGLKFYDPVLKWTSPPWASFDVIRQGLRAARLANPGLTDANRLATDLATIGEEIDFYNAALCQQMGWNEFIIGGVEVPQVPFHHPPRPPSVIQ